MPSKFPTRAHPASRRLIGGSNRSKSIAASSILSVPPCPDQVVGPKCGRTKIAPFRYHRTISLVTSTHPFVQTTVRDGRAAVSSHREPLANIRYAAETLPAGPRNAIRTNSQLRYLTTKSQTRREKKVQFPRDSLQFQQKREKAALGTVGRVFRLKWNMNGNQRS